MFKNLNSERKEWKRMKRKLRKWKEQNQEKQKDEVNDRIKQLDADILIEIRKGAINGIPKYIPFDENARKLACSKLIKSALERAKENLVVFDESRLYVDDYIVEYDDEEEEEDDEYEENDENTKIENKSTTF